MRAPESLSQLRYVVPDLAVRPEPVRPLDLLLSSRVLFALLWHEPARQRVLKPAQQAMVTIPIQLRIGGHPPAPGSLTAIARSRGERGAKAGLTMLSFCGLAGLVAILPPHLPWVLASVGSGFYFANRQWKSGYQVQTFSGSCPRCGHELTIAAGEKVRFPMKLSCYNCHHHPVATAAA